jgi:hypothetical protein
VFFYRLSRQSRLSLLSVFGYSIIESSSSSSPPLKKSSFPKEAQKQKEKKMEKPKTLKPFKHMEHLGF